MSFILGQTVIAIKLTNTGRDLLSKGELNFSKFAIGDSEIDYNFLRENPNYKIENTSILLPFDNEPDITSFVLKNPNSEQVNNLRLPSENIVSTVSNTIAPKGLIDPTTNEYRSDAIHVKQPDALVDNSTVNGGTSLDIMQADEYGTNVNEPIAGDYLFIKWGNPIFSGSGATDLSIDPDIVQLTYKIINVESGSLAGDNLVVEVDRELPNFDSSGTSFSRVLIYPNNNSLLSTGDAIQTYYVEIATSNFGEDSLFSFQENYDKRWVDVPVWNFTIINKENIEGVLNGEEGFADLPSVDYGGFVQYIERLDPTYENIGIVHFTNLSPSNILGEGLFYDENIPERLPTLIIPHVMWYNDSEDTQRLVLKPDFDSLAIYPDFNTPYLNLIDSGVTPMVVGKVFPDLKLFVIEDQELLAALSYKSNRNWTLPRASGDFNLQIC